MSRGEPDRLGYVTESTEREADLRSRDRAMLVRLCRVFGYCLLVLSVLAAVLALRVISAPMRDDMRLIIFAGMVLSVLGPGCTLLICGRMIRAGGTASVVVAVVTGMGGLVVTMLSVLVSVVAAWNHRPAATVYLTEAGIALLLTIGLWQLVHYALRVLTLRGRAGGDASAVVDLRERLGVSTPSGNVRRACLVGGGLALLLHLGLGAAAGWAFALSRTPVPVPPPAPAKVIAPELARPFDGDVYDFADGLPKAQRQVIVEVAGQELSLPPQGLEALDRGLREYGAILIGKMPQPLTPEAVRATLRFSHGPDADRPAFANQRWVSNGERSIVIEVYSDGLARAMYRKGDHGYSIPTGTRFHRDLARAPVYEAAQWVKDACPDELHLTTAQARTLYPLIADLSRMYDELKSVRQLADGSVEVETGERASFKVWITPGGEQVGSDPVEQARREEASRARLSEMRVFDITPLAPGAVMLASIAGLLVAGALVAAGWLPRLRRPAAVLQMGLSVLTLVGWVLLLRAANAMPEIHWTIQRAAAEPLHVLTALAALAVLVLGGLWIPLALVRRLEGAAVG